MLPFCTLFASADNVMNVCVAAWSHAFFVRGSMPRTFYVIMKEKNMEEKIIIKGERAEKKLGKKFLIISVILFFVGIIGTLFVPYFFVAEHFTSFKEYMGRFYLLDIILGGLYGNFILKLLFVMKCIGLLMLLIWVIYTLIYKFQASSELIVTDKRTYGKIAHGKRVDIPTDSISAIGACALKGIMITSASGAIKFHFLKNRDEIHNVLSKLIIERQGNKKEESAPSAGKEIDVADELKKYKDLLDSGVITQEDFDAKKQQLLGL